MRIFRQYNDDNNNIKNNNNSKNRNHKQYCCNKCNYDKTNTNNNNINNGALSIATEINTTTRKSLSIPRTSDVNVSIGNRCTNDVIAVDSDNNNHNIGDDRHIKNVCSCSNEKRAINHAHQNIATQTNQHHQNYKTSEKPKATNKRESSHKLNDNSNNVKNSRSKALKLKTQNNFITRLFLTDIVDTL